MEPILSNVGIGKKFKKFVDCFTVAFCFKLGYDAQWWQQSTFTDSKDGPRAECCTIDSLVQRRSQGRVLYYWNVRFVVSAGKLRLAAVTTMIC